MKPKSPILLLVGLVAIALFSCLSSGRAQPLPVTSPASNMLNDLATFNGTVNPDGEDTLSWFEWGSALVYGHSTPPQSVGSGFNAEVINAALTGLTSGATYHYRCVASN